MIVAKVKLFFEESFGWFSFLNIKGRTEKKVRALGAMLMEFSATFSLGCVPKVVSWDAETKGQSNVPA